MSARANPYENACTESFIGTLKLEMLQAGCFENASDAHVEIFDSIKGYYNTHRKYSAIGYKTPSQFEAQFHHAEQPTKRSKNQLHLRFSYALTKFIAAKAPTSTRLV
jgi:transposase InsO family protein